jgi:hypothetical protein
MIFVDCPAYLDARGLARCGLPAEIQDPYLVQSTDGPLASARTKCPRGHCFNGTIQSLTWDKNQAQPATSTCTGAPSCTPSPAPRRWARQPRQRPARRSF